MSVKGKNQKATKKRVQRDPEDSKKARLVIPRLADGKGRVVLGSQFAGCLLDVDTSDPNRIVITRVVAIPAQEAWLYQNPKALELVRSGLEEAVTGKISSDPIDLEGDVEFVSQLSD